MSVFFSARPPRWLQAVFVFLLTVAIIALLFDRPAWRDWSVPHWLEGDPLEVYARVKIAAEQPGAVLFNLTTVEALGAPIGADWTGYPAPDRFVFALAGWLAHGIGLIAAVQVMSACLLGLNAASLFLCGRWLRWRGEWAAALGVIFALCTYNIRWGITLSFSQTFTLPPLILLCARAARGGAQPGRAWHFLAAGLGVWLAQGNPYLAYFSGVVAGGALLLALVRRSPSPRLGLLLLFLGVLSGCFLAVNAGHLRHLLADPAANPLVRSLDDMRTYALRPMEWLVPPADHRLAFLGGIGRHYQELHRGQGEFFYNYLGLVGVTGLVALGVTRIFAPGRRRRPRLDPVFGLIWITLFGVVGGINYWVGVAGIDLFRAGTRIGIFAQVWICLFLGGWLTRRLRPAPRGLSAGLAAALTLAAVWDQTPPLHHTPAQQHNLSRWQDYAAVTRQLEQDLPAGAAVFQLPAVPFPEAGRTGVMPDYEHLLPYLTSQSLRYSYGQLRPAPALRWARHVGRLPAAELVATLEKAGFSVLWIDTRAYADAAVALVASLQATGRSELQPARRPREIRLFRLNPAANPPRPDFDDPRLQDPWDESSGRPGLLALRGWYSLETDGKGNHWRWGGREAALGIWAEPADRAASLRFRLGGPAASVVVLRLNGREIGRAAPGPESHVLEVPLHPGLNTLVWRLEGAVFRPGGSDPRKLGFMVENLTMSVP